MFPSFAYGSDEESDTRLERRAKRKAMAYTLGAGLVKIADELDDFEMKRKFTHLSECASWMWYDGSIERTKYCKLNFCPVCTSIAKAKRIRYCMPVIGQLPQPYKLVLTTKSVYKDTLKERVSESLKVLRAILDYGRHLYRNGRGEKPIGIYTLECNYNPKKQWYNPHINIIVDGAEMADFVRSEWVKRWGGLPLVRPQQFVAKVYAPQKQLIEVFKYFTKVIGGTKGEKEKDNNFYWGAYYNIFKAIDKQRIYGRFGFKYPKLPPYVRNDFSRFPSECHYNPKTYDWEDERGKKVAGYQIPDEYKAILDKGLIDSEIALGRVKAR